MKNSKRILFGISIIFFLFWSCNSLKQTEKTMLSGDYDKAIKQALGYLREHPRGKKTSDFTKILQKSYAKANVKDKDEIAYLEKEQNPENLEKIFLLYNQLNDRQQKIKPILRDNMHRLFAMQDYTEKLIETKEKLVAYLYNKSSETLEYGQAIQDFREAYDDLGYVNKLSPNYKDTKLKMREAHFRGTVFVQVKIQNHSEKVIPKRLERELLDFDTYGINNFWTVYQSKYDKDITYHYEILLNITNINISPEQVREREIIEEKQIKDGYSYLEDEEGNLVKDSLGNAIKVDKLRTIRCELLEVNQLKSVRILGNVVCSDLFAQQVVNKHPLSSEFVFEHRFGTANGDRRALASSYLRMLKHSRVSFPSNEQMIYDAGQDLKNKLKGILVKQKF